MKKIRKYNTNLSSQKINLSVDKSLNKLKGKVLAPKKLADANKLLRQVKSPLPK